MRLSCPSTGTAATRAIWPCTLQSDIEDQPRVRCCNMKNSNNIALNCATTKRHTVVCPLVMERIVTYLRVSTRQQQRSGLGIDAQRAAIERFAATESLSISAEFVEFA